MKTISRIAKQFRLSRTALLYYDSAGLIKASRGSLAGYRLYGKNEERRLELVCMYRKAGLSLKDIKSILATGKGSAFRRILEKRFSEINAGIQELKSQQMVILALLKNERSLKMGKIGKDAWIKMFREAGLSESQMKNWHRIFEKQSPEGHQEFLEFLNIPEEEIKLIRSHVRGKSA